MVRCALEFDFLDVIVAADPTPYVSLVDGCTAEECHSRLGQRIVGHLVSGHRWCVRCEDAGCARQRSRRAPTRCASSSSGVRAAGSGS